MDYFIHLEEDREEGDLNFVDYYSSREHCHQRLKYFVRNALRSAGEMPKPFFHRTVVKGLLALYLSDPKIKKQQCGNKASSLLAATGEKDTFYLYHLCLLLRKAGLL